MTPENSILCATCLLTTSLLLYITEPFFKYVLAVFAVFLWAVFTGFFPVLLVGIPIIVVLELTAARSNARTEYDLKNFRIFMGFTVWIIVFTCEMGVVRLMWPLLSKLYGWQPDIDKLAGVMEVVCESLPYILVPCAAFFVLLAMTLVIAGASRTGQGNRPDSDLKPLGATAAA